MKYIFKNLIFIYFILFLFSITIYANDESKELQQVINFNSEIIIDNNIKSVNKNITDYMIKDKNINSLAEKDLKIYNIIKDVPIYTPTKFTPITTESESEEDNIITKKIQTIFEDGENYFMNRISFKQNLPSRYQISIPIEGNTITVRYVDPVSRTWVNTSNMSNLKHSTLFIDTDTHSYIFSVPAVYRSNLKEKTLTIIRKEEQLIKIEKKDGYFDLKISFPQNKDLIGEYWYMKSEKRLVDWSKQSSFNELLPHDLSESRRWTYDGYYFQTPLNYLPGGKDVLYQHPSNYTGASFVKYSINLLSKNLGYVMTETCIKNQNEFGYWETGPKSNWLFKDFKIGEGFYDTRFNTDFATSLLYAYQKYNNKEFLASSVKYAEYFLEFAQKNSYITENGGILVEDYGYRLPHERTHVSLNHHITEMNFLYEIYNITREKRYLEIADKMLLGVEDTRNKWVLPNGNLNYALYYTKNTNKMEDYPYLTYNDLFQTKNLLIKLFNKTNDTIEFLMASKKQWMDENKISGYMKEILFY